MPKRVLLVLLLAATASASSVAAQAGHVALPSRAELGDGWTTLRPGGETRCARGGDFEFYVRRGDAQRLLVFLYGGGACWTAGDCATDAGIYVHTLAPSSHPQWLGGIFEFTEPANPFRDFDVVAVPYCTGDVFLGDRDAVYRTDAGAGEPREFTIHHRGQASMRAVLEWIHGNYSAPARIVVAGSSAGAAVLPLYAQQLARHYPQAQVVGIGDDAGSYGPITESADLSAWGLPEALQAHPGWESYQRGLRVDALYTIAGRGAPNLRLYQIDHAWDARQRYFLELAGAPEDTDISAVIRANRASIRRQLPEFRSVTLGGFMHTSFVARMFYHYRAGDISLRDWVARAAAGEAVPDVECDDCVRPRYAYDNEDLAILDRAIELLSVPGAWNPHDPGGPCPTTGDSFPLRCAISRAIRAVSARPLGNLTHAAAVQVIHEAAERAGWLHPNGIIAFNNREGTTLEDVLQLLRDVRQRVASAPAAGLN